MNRYAVFSAIFTFTNIENVSSGRFMKSAYQPLTSLMINYHEENISFSTQQLKISLKIANS